tara:strand:+ start:41 stop:2047 length:2007 start_codon:yes stop_codon:yes gene_type:complete
MATFNLKLFGGIAPRVSARLLADQLAQNATDVNLESGNLKGFKTDSVVNPKSGVTTLSNSSRQTIFEYTTDNWLQFDEDVNVQRGPLPGDNNDTIYWSGQSFPKMGRNTDVLGGSVYPNAGFRLGIPAPTAAPTVAVVPTNNLDGIITFTNESSTVTVTTKTSGTLTAHGASVGEFIVLVGFSTSNGVTAENINGTYKIKTVPTSSSLTIDLSAAATSSGDSPSVANGARFGDNSEAELDYETSYVYTFVSAYGEEGPPSPASTVITTDDNMSVNVTQMETSTTKSNVNFGTGAKKRIYRSNTGSNTSDFQFVGEVPLATTDFVDSSSNADLAEIIASTFHIAPPDDDTALYPEGPMKGLTSLPNGVFAGFTGKRVCFSEPFLPHAWPVSYRISLDEEVVGMAAGANGVVVGTKGTPYLIAGTDPSGMQAVRIEAGQACLNKRSMVDMGPYVIYASPDGLVAVTGATVQILTEQIITPEQWQASYYPSTIVASMWEGRYVGFYNTGSGFGGFVFDPRGGANAFVNLDASALVRGLYTDPDNNQLYKIIGNQIKKFQGGGTSLTYNWKSKEFVTPKTLSMAFLAVRAEAFPVTVKVYGDGSLIYNATISTSGSIFSVTGTTPSFSATDITEPIVRLPASMHNTYAVEVESSNVVHEVAIGDNLDELRSA